MPKTYENEMATQLMANTQTLSRQLEVAPQDQWQSLLIQFCMENSTGTNILDENGEQVVGSSISFYTADNDIVAQNENEATTSFNSIFEKAGKQYMVVAYANTRTVEQVTGIFAAGEVAMTK